MGMYNTGTGKTQTVKTYSVLIDGEQVTSSAYSIVTSLRDMSFMNKNLSLEDFIKEVQYNTWKLFAVGINIDQNLNISDKCEQLVKQLINHKLLPSQ